MKAKLTCLLSESQLKAMLASLAISDCKKLITFLQKRIQSADEQKRQKQKGLRTWDDAFLNTPVEKFELHPRIINCLREHELFTVKDITDLGVDNLIMFRGIGEKIAQDIKREIFNIPLDRICHLGKN